jgi:hypothetical protein
MDGTAILQDPRLRAFMGGPVAAESAPALSTQIAAPGPAQKYIDAGAALMPSQPRVSMGGGAPAMGMPMMPTVTKQPTQTQSDQRRLNDTINSGSGVDQIHNGLGRGLARVADIAASVFAPRLAQALPGTTMHHEMLIWQQQAKLANDQAQEQATTQLADSNAQVEQRQALAQQEQAKAASLADPHKAVDPSKTVTTDDGVYQLNPDTGRYDQRVGDRVEKQKSPEQAAYDYSLAQGKSPLDAFTDVKNAGNVKDASFQQQFLDAYKKAHPEAPNTDAISATIRATSTQPKIDIHTADMPRDVGTWTPGFDKDRNPILFNSKTGEVKPNSVGFTKTTAAGMKISADEQKRADLAKNMNENIEALDDIATRRPELFGPIAGRYTEMKNRIGTSDNDISKLEAIKHQLGMVSQGAHGMRSAQGVESAANSLINSFHNSAEATKAGLGAARQSVRTFTDDANNPGASRGPSMLDAPSAHTIQIGNKSYTYNGSGATDDMKSYTEVRK